MGFEAFRRCSAPSETARSGLSLHVFLACEVHAIADVRADFVICVLWSTQAVLIQNITVLIPNGLGIVLGARTVYAYLQDLGVAQLVLYACYCRTSCDERAVMLSSAV